MIGSGQETRPQMGCPPPWLNETELFMKMDPVRNSQPTVEIQKVRTAAQQDMLAVVHQFGVVPSGGPRRGTAPQKGPGFVQVNVKARIPQRYRRCKTGQPTPNDGYARHPNSQCLTRQRVLNIPCRYNVLFTVD